MSDSIVLSVVIPVYNEARYIGRCLDRLLEQAQYISEIVVVDNNSSDSTPDIVREYARQYPFIGLITEREQGCVYARTTGLNAATGDVLARIDADTLVHAGWARTIVEYFARDTEEDVAAATGFNFLYESPLAGARKFYLTRQMRKLLVDGERTCGFVQGANMAMRRDAWLKMRDQTTDRNELHEDIDLSCCMYHAGLKIVQLGGMLADVAGRRNVTPPLAYLEYVRATKRTLDLHGLCTPQLRRLIVWDWFTHLFYYAVSRPWDADRGRYSLRYLLDSSKAARPLPGAANPADQELN